jgi:hypothetical protein
MRLAGRFIPRETILAAVATYELVEAYADDKYLPSYVILARHGSDAFHVLFATDVRAIMCEWSHRTAPTPGSGRPISRSGGRSDEVPGLRS